MAGLSKAVKIGVIVEAQNDIDVLYELTCKIIRENRFSFLRFVGHGGGAIRKKCASWGKNLLERGCSHLVVVHDLDKNDEKLLRKELEDKIKELRYGHAVVLIPIEEMEAWLLCDARALKTVFSMRRTPSVPRWPEKTAHPKEFLASLVWSNSKKRYLNTIHNRSIARALMLPTLKRCPSFLLYPRFLRSVFATTA